MPRVDLDARRDPKRSAPLLIGIISRVDGERYGPGPFVKISRHVKRVPGGTISPLRTAAMYAHTRVASACDLVKLRSTPFREKKRRLSMDGVLFRHRSCWGPGCYQDHHSKRKRLKVARSERSGRSIGFQINVSF